MLSDRSFYPGSMSPRRRQSSKRGACMTQGAFMCQEYTGSMQCHLGLLVTKLLVTFLKSRGKEK